MAHAEPATIAKEVNEELVQILRRLTRYMDDETFALRQLRARIGQLMKVDAAAGWVSMATYWTLLGKVEDARHAASNALRLTNDPTALSILATNVYMNLGDYAAALNCMLESAHPHRGNFSNSIGWLVLAGGFRAATEYCGIARGMGLEIPELPIKLEKAVEAMDLFDGKAISDVDVAKMLTASAGVLVERRQLTSDQRNSLFQYDDGTVCYGFPVATTAEGAADLMFEMSDRLANLGVLSSVVGISVFPFMGADADHAMVA